MEAEELAERDCGACVWERNLWAEIVERTGDRMYGEIAMEMLDLDEYIEVFRIPPSEVLASEWEYLKVVRGERARRAAYHNWKAGEASRKHGGKG